MQYQCECGSTAFSAEQHGWEVRDCVLVQDGDIVKACNFGRESFTEDDGGPEYICAECGTACPMEVTT